MSKVMRLSLLILTLSACTSWSQSTPYIGYLYPAGCQRGTSARIVVGGQYLRGPVGVLISGQHVSGKIIEYTRPFFNLNGDQRKLVMDRIKAQRDRCIAKIQGKKPPQHKPLEIKGVKMVNHPLLMDIENKSLLELAHITTLINFPRNKRQQNRQLAESVIVEITAGKQARPGRYELRLQTANGLTNPVVFEVGALPESSELEPNDREANPVIPKIPVTVKNKPLNLPITVNGQIMPGDVDRLAFRAQKGQSLVITVHARSLIPYLADAVPGWFQATLTLYNASGKELAFDDDFGINPDPAIHFVVPETGIYELEIRDAIYRGREDFVYRVSISSQPFITSIFPLGAPLGTETTVQLHGWNLPQKTTTLNAKNTDGRILHTQNFQLGDHVSNEITWTTDNLPECREKKDNNSPQQAQPIKLPMIINGQFEKEGDIDVFSFTGKAGQKIVAEVMARRLNSPVDSLLRIVDSSNKTIALNDDHFDRDKTFLHRDISGLTTHLADSYIMTRLPADGRYYVYMTDSQNHGGPDYGYRLRLSHPRPDFALRMAPSKLNLQPGKRLPVAVYALRRDGFQGPITIAMAESSAKQGFTITGSVIPAGSDSVRMVLQAPAKAPPLIKKPVAVKCVGSGIVNGKKIVRPVRPAEDTMQAFLYRHLVPCDSLLAVIRNQKWSNAPAELISPSPIKITPGGKVPVKIKTWKRSQLQDMEMELIDAPAGISITDYKVLSDGFTFNLKADKEIAQPLSDNLIIETFIYYLPKDKTGKVTGPKRRTSAGHLPAIPIQIVKAS